MIVSRIFFYFLLAAPIVKNSHILAVIYFILLKKNVLDQKWKSFNIKVGPQQKVWKSSYQVRQFSALFCNLAALILS